MNALLTSSFPPRFEQSAVKNVFIRGSVVRYVHLPAGAVDIPLLEDATRRGRVFRSVPFLSVPSVVSLSFSCGRTKVPSTSCRGNTPVGAV